VANEWFECDSPDPPTELSPGDTVHPRGLHFRLEPDTPANKRRKRRAGHGVGGTAAAAAAVTLLLPAAPAAAVDTTKEASSTVAAAAVTTEPALPTVYGGVLFWSVGTVLRQLSPGCYLVEVRTATATDHPDSGASLAAEAAVPPVNRILRSEQLVAAAPETFFYSAKLGVSQWHRPIDFSLPRRKPSVQPHNCSSSGAGTGNSTVAAASEEVSDDSGSDSDTAATSKTPTIAAVAAATATGAATATAPVTFINVGSTSTNSSGNSATAVRTFKCGPPPLSAQQWAALRATAARHRALGSYSEYRERESGALFYYDTDAAAREAAAARLQAWHRQRRGRPWPRQRWCATAAFCWQMPGAAETRARELCAWAYLKRRSVRVRDVSDAQGDVWTEVRSCLCISTALLHTVCNDAGVTCCVYQLNLTCGSIAK
jgi:hypothetical protein